MLLFGGGEPAELFHEIHLIHGRVFIGRPPLDKSLVRGFCCATPFCRQKKKAHAFFERSIWCEMIVAPRLSNSVKRAPRKMLSRFPYYFHSDRLASFSCLAFYVRPRRDHDPLFRHITSTAFVYDPSWATFIAFIITATHLSARTLCSAYVFLSRLKTKKKSAKNVILQPTDFPSEIWVVSFFLLFLSPFHQRRADSSWVLYKMEARSSSLTWIAIEPCPATAMAIIGDGEMFQVKASAPNTSSDDLIICVARKFFFFRRKWRCGRCFYVAHFLFFCFVVFYRFWFMANGYAYVNISARCCVVFVCNSGSAKSFSSLSACQRGKKEKRNWDPRPVLGATQSRIIIST